MEGFFHSIQHSIQHFWCCYWPAIKSMIIPGMGLAGTLGILKYKIKLFLSNRS